MRITIAGPKLGTDQNLVHDGKNFAWSSGIPIDSWTYGFKNSDKDIGFVVKSLGVDTKLFDDTPHEKAAKTVFGKDCSKIAWIHTMPKDIFLKHVMNLLEQLWCVIDDESNSYYKERLLDNRKLLSRLVSPIVDTSLAKQIMKSSHVSQLAEISKFLPSETGEVRSTKYNLAGSVTGRLTVESGPNILTLKKESRKIFLSRYPGGKIIQLDISSLEPRIALAVSGKPAPDDIYSFICNNLFEGSLTRDQAKVAILSCIYGASQFSLSKRLPSNLSVSKVISEIKRHFGILSLESSLSREYSKNGFIENLYGRKIFADGAHVNHFLQSTGVDISFSVFSKILEKFDNSKIEYTPLYLIHDAIMLDVSKDGFEFAKTLEKEKFKIEELDCNFPIKLEIIKEK
tara:strand:+ start:13868 stop:15067 length:1200 start_codon:yes stop_codon:yes gene_type:complete